MGTYSAELAKGQGSIPEILTLLEHWEPGMSSQTLAKMTVEQGLLCPLERYAREGLGDGRICPPAARR